MNKLFPAVMTGTLLSATSISALSAQESDVEVVVVTATRTAESLASLPYTVQVIDEKQLQEQITAGMDLGGMLSQLVPGLAPSDNSVTSYYQSLRGRQVLVLIDGVAQRSNRNISRQLTTISPANIERVEVISGATAIYGAGATGGVINLITKKGQDQDIRFSNTVALTSSTKKTDSDNLTYAITQTANGTIGNFGFHAGATYESRGTYIDADGNQIANDPNQLSRNESNTIDLLFNGSYQFNDQQSLDISLEYFDEEMDSDFAADFGDPTAASFGLPTGLLAAGGAYVPTPRKGLQLDNQPASERQSITLTFSDEDVFGQRFMSQINYRDAKASYYPYPGVPLALNANWQNVAGVLTPQQVGTWQAEAVAGGATTEGDVRNYILGQVGRAIFANAAPSASITQSTVNTQILDIKAAFSSEFTVGGSSLGLTYGIDVIRDEGEQTSTEYNYQDWVSSEQLTYNPTGNIYSAGPKTETDTEALFLQASYQVNDKLKLRGGIRREWVSSDVADYLSDADAINASIYQTELQNPFLQGIAAGLGFGTEQFLATATNALAQSANFDRFLTYSDNAIVREGGTASYDATLLNAGAIYQLSQGQDIYLNYGEGFTTPDMTRLLRSLSVLSGVQPGPILDGTNVDAVTTNSWDLGWRGQFNNTHTQLSFFYNESDKNVQFDALTGVVTIVDQEERIWGFEGLVEARVADFVTLGATYAYTSGETLDQQSSEWIALPANRIAPQKITSFIKYEQGDNFDVRLQLQHIADYSDAADDDNGVDFEGYTTADLLANVQLGLGHASLAVRNLSNEDYKSLYNQVRGRVATGASAYLPAQGRTFSLGYTINF